MSVIGGRILFVLLAAILPWPAGAADLSVDDALDRAGDGLAGAVGREHLNHGGRIALANFMDSAGVACEPLTGLIKGGIRKSLVKHLGRMGHNAKVVEMGDPGEIEAAVSGTWMKGANDQVRLTVKLGEIKSMLFANLGMEEVTFTAASLPVEARDCLLQYRPVEREVTAKTALVARASPTPIGHVIARVEPGQPVWVAARLTAKDGDKWFVVRLPDDEQMPVGMRERKGFVYDLVVPLDPERDFEIAELDGMAVAVGTATLRPLPLAKGDAVTELAAGDAVRVSGRVLGKPWFRVAWKDGDAYVHEASLKTIDKAEYGAWQKAKQAKEAGPLEAFLKAWPASTFAVAARERLAAIKPPLKVDAWVDKGTFRQGERVRIHLKGNGDFYAALFYKDAEGAMIQLLPNAWRADAFFRGGEEHVVPGPNDRFDLEIRPPFGNETIFVFASRDALPRVSGKVVAEGLTLVGPDMRKIRGAMRGIGFVPKPAAGEPATTGPAPSVEASVSLTTVP